MFKFSVFLRFKFSSSLLPLSLRSWWKICWFLPNFLIHQLLEFHFNAIVFIFLIIVTLIICTAFKVINVCGIRLIVVRETCWSFNIWFIGSQNIVLFVLFGLFLKGIFFVNTVTEYVTFSCEDNQEIKLKFVRIKRTPFKLMFTLEFNRPYALLVVVSQEYWAVSYLCWIFFNNS